MARRGATGGGALVRWNRRLGVMHNTHAKNTYTHTHTTHRARAHQRPLGHIPRCPPLLARAHHAGALLALNASRSNASSAPSATSTPPRARAHAAAASRDGSPRRRWSAPHGNFIL